MVAFLKPIDVDKVDYEDNLAPIGEYELVIAKPPKVRTSKKTDAKYLNLFMKFAKPEHERFGGIFGIVMLEGPNAIQFPRFLAALGVRRDTAGLDVGEPDSYGECPAKLVVADQAIDLVGKKLRAKIKHETYKGQKVHQLAYFIL